MKRIKNIMSQILLKDAKFTGNIESSNEFYIEFHEDGTYFKFEVSLAEDDYCEMTILVDGDVYDVVGDITIADIADRIEALTFKVIMGS